MMIYMIISLLFGGIATTVEVWSPRARGDGRGQHPAPDLSAIGMGIFVAIFWPLLALPIALDARKRKQLLTDHCDDYIDDPKAPEALRKFLAFARGPAHGLLTEKPHPRLFADYKGKRVRVTMASLMGDVGISPNLDAETGYHERVRVSQLENFSEVP
jgi:hypothetical protein